MGAPSNTEGNPSLGEAAVRVVIGGVVGGTILLLWAVVGCLHVRSVGLGGPAVVALHETSIRQLPYEENIIQALRAYVKQPGFYAFPAWLPHTRDTRTEALSDYRKSWTARVRRGPVGTLTIRPHGETRSPRERWLIEWVTQVVAAVIAAWILWLLGRTFFVRWLVASLLGVFASVVVVVPQWTWMAAPPEYAVALGVELGIGWVLAGLVLAAIMRRPPS